MKEDSAKTPERPYGTGDATYLAAGEEQGVRHLVDAFYDEMVANPDYRRVREMHPPDLTESRDRLARFLCGWMGGPKLYREPYGQIRIPVAHAHLDIGPRERDQWLACMATALERHACPQDLKEYLLVQLAVPADRIVAACRSRAAAVEDAD